MAWASKFKKLTGAGDTIEIIALGAKKFQENLAHYIASGALDNNKLRVGSGSLDSGTNYAYRHSTDGVADSTNTNDTGITTNGINSAQDHFVVTSGINILAEEKLFIIHCLHANTAGAGNAPQRYECVAKWANTSSAFNDIGHINAGSGDFDTDSLSASIETDN